MVWYSHLFKNFPQFIVIHTVKDFSLFNEVEVDVFLEFFAFPIIQQMLAIWPLVPLPFLNLTYICKFSVHVLLKRAAAAAAAAKSCQSCPTLCDPIDGSPPGSPISGIFQARTLEWVAIAFSNAWKWKVKVKSLSCVRL